MKEYFINSFKPKKILKPDFLSIVIVKKNFPDYLMRLGMKNKGYKVLWSTYARVSLARAKEYKVDPMNVFRRSKVTLTIKPQEKAYGISDFPDYEFNGYYWTLIGNVVIIYRVDDNLLEVNVDACYFANTGLSHYIFWGIDPDAE